MNKLKKTTLLIGLTLPMLGFASSTLHLTVFNYTNLPLCASTTFGNNQRFYDPNCETVAPLTAKNHMPVEVTIPNVSHVNIKWISLYGTKDPHRADNNSLGFSLMDGNLGTPSYTTGVSGDLSGLTGTPIYVVTTMNVRKKHHTQSIVGGEPSEAQYETDSSYRLNTPFKGDVRGKLYNIEHHEFNYEYDVTMTIENGTDICTVPR